MQGFTPKMIKEAKESLRKATLEKEKYVVRQLYKEGFTKEQISIVLRVIRA